MIICSQKALHLLLLMAKKIIPGDIKKIMQTKVLQANRKHTQIICFALTIHYVYLFLNLRNTVGLVLTLMRLHLF